MKATTFMRGDLKIATILMLNLIMVSGCSDGADSAELPSEALCSPSEVLLNETPPALEAVCSVPPTPISSLIELQFSQTLSEQERRRNE